MDLTRRWVIGGLATAGLTGATQKAEPIEMKRDLSHLPPDKRAAFEAMYARMMAALPYERITVPGKDAMAAWEKLRASGRGWPLVIGNDEDVERIADQFTMGDPVVSGGPAGPRRPSPAQILAAAAKIQFPADLYTWAEIPPPGEEKGLTGDWPSPPTEAAPGLAVAVDLQTGRLHDKVHILVLPTDKSWEAPAYLRWGGWNACPPPDYHVAALRSWHDRFGAELVGINGDTMNIRVRHPARDRRQALILAQEFQAYCTDIVDQGVGSMTALASELMREDWWFFWWD